MAPTELHEQANVLARQERLLEQALQAGVAGEQRRVQRGLLRETRAELAQARRTERAVEAGWEPFEPSPEWSWGYVEDPRFLRGRARLISAVGAVAVATITGAIMAARWDVVAAACLAFTIMFALQPVLHAALGQLAERHDTAMGGDLRVFSAPIPAQAAVAYRRARESRLFDTFVVHSPRAEDFRTVEATQAPSLGLLDPVLAGRIGRHSFLIAQWDLAKDLAQV